MPTTLILGASDNPERYAYKAAGRLLANGQQIVLLGKKKTEIFGLPITNVWPEPGSVDTITVYMSEANQQAFYEDILHLKPRRVIFNPGAENPELEDLLHENGIETEEACTLTLLALGRY